MKINNLEEIRDNLNKTKTEMAALLGISRVTYYKAVETGELSDEVVFANPGIFGIERPDDFYKYTPESLRASMNFHRLGYADFQDKWGEEYGYSTMWSLANSQKSLYYLKDLFDSTFHPVIVPCEVIDGKYVPAKAPKYQRKTKMVTKEEFV